MRKAPTNICSYLAPKILPLALRALAPDPASVFSFPPLSLCGPGLSFWDAVRYGWFGVTVLGMSDVRGWIRWGLERGWLEGCQVLEDVDGRAGCVGVGWG